MKKFYLLFIVIFFSYSMLYSQDASGVYSTNFNEMTLHQKGNTVTGTYKFKGGRIEGTIEGKVLVGWWYQENGKGKIHFIFNDDFTSFNGKWGYDDEEPVSAWTGTKTRNVEEQKKEKKKHISSKVDGTYETNFNILTLKQSGAKVTGNYLFRNGRIEGTLDGQILTGRWYQDSGEGRLRFEFSSDFSAFTGKWSYDDEEPDSQWNGTKIK